MHFVKKKVVIALLVSEVICTIFHEYLMTLCDFRSHRIQQCLQYRLINIHYPALFLCLKHCITTLYRSRGV